MAQATKQAIVRMIWRLAIWNSMWIATACSYNNEVELYGEENCETEVASYSSSVSDVIRHNCLACHNAKDNSGEVTLETYAQVRAVAESGKLIGVITHAQGFPAMPKDAPQLSQCKIDAIRKWIEEGTLEN